MQHQEAQPCLEVDGRLHLPRLACMEDLGGDRWNIMPSVTLPTIGKRMGRKCQTVRCLGAGWAHAVGAGRVRFGLCGMLRSRPLGITPPPLQAAPGDKELAALQLGHCLEELLQEVQPGRSGRSRAGGQGTGGGLWVAGRRAHARHCMQPSWSVLAPANPGTPGQTDEQHTQALARLPSPHGSHVI